MALRRALRNWQESGAHAQWQTSPQVEVCPLCARPISDRINADRHHLIPKSRGGTECFWVHRICHQAIHATLSEKELERSYHSWDALRAHPEVADFIRWVANKPPTFYAPTQRNHRRRST